MDVKSRQNRAVKKSPQSKRRHTKIHIPPCLHATRRRASGLDHLRGQPVSDDNPSTDRVLNSLAYAATFEKGGGNMAGVKQMKLDAEQLATVLFRATNEPRRFAKGMLKRLGGEGSAVELDRVLANARADREAMAIYEQMECRRRATARAVEAGVDGGVAEMLADIRLRIQYLGITQDEVAHRVGWPASLLSAYLTGEKQPGIGNLAKLAGALECVWRLTPENSQAQGIRSRTIGR